MGEIMPFKVPEEYRIKSGSFPTSRGDRFGWFQCDSPDKSRINRTLLVIIASGGDVGIPWEHVSVRAVKNVNGKPKNLLPNWSEMCFIKSLFWDDEDVVMQLHPRKSEYVNRHESVLHLWRPTDCEIPTPPKICV